MRTIPGDDGQRGAASVEWTALVLLVSIVFGAAVAIAPEIDGRSFGGFLAHTILCTIGGDCEAAGDAELLAAYGSDDAALLREYAPNLTYEPGERSLPIDWRACRVRACSRAPDRAGLDAHLSDAGDPATMFTHIVHRGEETFLQYWAYYPYSSTVIGNTREGVGSIEVPVGQLGKLAEKLGVAAAVPKALNPWSLTDRVIRMSGEDPDPAPRIAQAPKYWARMPLPARAIAWFMTDGSMNYPGFHYDDWEVD